MFDFQGKKINSNVSQFKMFVDIERNNYNISGILLNEYYGFMIKFKGIREMLSSLDKLFDYVSFPMPSHSGRMFFENKEQGKKELPENLFEYVGSDLAEKIPKFVLSVQFRQNATWQGELEWIEKGKTKKFISDLQLINMIIEAVGLRK